MEKCTKKPYGKSDVYGGALRASRKTGKPMRGYKCDKCEHWHITRKRRWKT